MKGRSTRSGLNHAAVNGMEQHRIMMSFRENSSIIDIPFKYIFGPYGSMVTGRTYHGQQGTVLREDILM